MTEFRKECAFPTKLWKKDPEVEALRQVFRENQTARDLKLPPAPIPRQQSTQRSLSIDRISLTKR